MTTPSVPIPTIDELTSHCFGCGHANPQGLHLTFTIHAENDTITATAPINLTRIHEGPRGFIHGGIIATLLDEAMSKLDRPLGLLAVTRNMNIDYLHPSPLHQPLTLIGRHIRREGRKLFHEAELQNAEGKVLAKAQGLFIALDAATIAKAGLIQPED